MQGDFWHFATHLYAGHQVAEACLWLQDRHDLDVMLLLLCLWTGIQRGSLQRSQLEALMAVGEPWRRNVVNPLRSTRRWLKYARPGCVERAAAEHGREKLRQAITATELIAERLQGELYEALIGEWEVEKVHLQPGTAAAESNVRLYAALLSVALDSDDDQRLQVILQALPEPS